MVAHATSVRIIAAVLAIATASGCGARGQRAETSTVTITSTIAGTTTSAIAGTTTTTPQNQPGGVRLYQQFEAERSVGPNGKPINATLAGTSFPDATGMWVGCGGQPATTTYRLDHKFSRLHAIAGLEPTTPDGLETKATITGDGRVLQEFTIQKTDTQKVDLDLTGMDTLVVAAIALNPTLCGASSTPYGALGDAVLTPVG
jgi:NPCBM/NEW2 domain